MSDDRPSAQHAPGPASGEPGPASPAPSSARPPAAPSPRAPSLTVQPLTGLGEIREGADLGAELAAALTPLSPQDGDVLCVSTKIVSKALGLRIAPGRREQAIEEASVRMVARRLHTRVVTSVVQIPSGPVMAAAGVDSSNAPEGPLLLPEDPDACARHLREVLVAALGVEIGVLLTDTSSRIWRVGVGDIALGAAGVASLQDLRGAADADGRALTVTVRNLADELAAAADLVKGKASGIPAALVRGVPGATAREVPARELSRTGPEDWFRRPSLESVWVALGLTPAQEPIARMSPEPGSERIARALAVAAMPRGGGPAPTAGARVVLDTPESRTAAGTDGRAGSDGEAGATEEPGVPRRISIEPRDASPDALLEAATLAERIRTALGAESLGLPLPGIPVEVTTYPPPSAAPAPAPPVVLEDPS